jgi:hypothetical protein
MWIIEDEDEDAGQQLLILVARWRESCPTSCQRAVLQRSTGDSAEELAKRWRNGPK